MNSETQKNKIIEEIYTTGRYNGEYMGVKAKSKQNPIKSYIKQWLLAKGIRENLNEMIEDFYSDLFVNHICKMKAEKLIELAENNTKLMATICFIIEKHQMKIDVSPIIKFLYKYLRTEYNLQLAEIENKLYWTEVSVEEYKELKNINKKFLNQQIIPNGTSIEYLIKVLWVHLDVIKNKTPNKNISYFEKQNYQSSQYNSNAIEVISAKNKEEKAESEFYHQFGIGINDILDKMTHQELDEFKRLANKNKRKRGTVEQKENEKTYWDNLEEKVLNTVNRIKFKN